MGSGRNVKGRLANGLPLCKQVESLSCMLTQTVHPHYRDLHAELLARPFPVVSTPVMVSHRAILRGSAQEEGHRAVIAEAIAMAGPAGVMVDQPGFHLLRIGEVDLRIERHHEFTSFTVIAPVAAGASGTTGAPVAASAPFAARACELLPAGWLERIPGELMVAVELTSERLSLSRAGGHTRRDGTHRWLLCR